jgi:formylglycine-generating enzyme required for sulfatase activity
MLRTAGVTAILLTAILFPSPSICQTATGADIDASGEVDFADFVLFAQAIGKQTGQEGYDASCDLDGSGKVDFQDFVEFARLFTQTASLQPATYSVSGQVTEYMKGLGNVVVRLKGAHMASTQTGDDGTYAFEDLQDGDYTLIPYRKTYVFEPDSLTFKLSGSDLPGLDLVARQSLYTVRLSSTVKMELIWVRPGSFLMGSPEDEPDRTTDEGPQHRVTLTRGFHLGKHEVTQAQWQALMRTVPWSGEDNVQVGPNSPAVNVTWYNAQSFIAEMNEP